MKHLYRLFFVAIAMVCLWGCKKDDSDATSIPQELIGKWHQVSERQVFYVDGVKTSEHEQTDYSPNTYVEYSSNGTVSYNQDGQVQDTYKFSVKNNMLTLTDNSGKPIDADAKITVTATTLNLHQDITFQKSNETGTIDYDFVRVD